MLASLRFLCPHLFLLVWYTCAHSPCSISSFEDSGQVSDSSSSSSSRAHFLLLHLPALALAHPTPPKQLCNAQCNFLTHSRENGKACRCHVHMPFSLHLNLRNIRCCLSHSIAFSASAAALPEQCRRKLTCTKWLGSRKAGAVFTPQASHPLMMKQASLALAYPQACVKQEGAWLYWQQRAPSHAQQLSELGRGPGGYIAPQAARYPLSAFALNNPHRKYSLPVWGVGVYGGGPRRAVAKLQNLGTLKKSYFTPGRLREGAEINEFIARYLQEPWYIAI